MKLQSAIYTNRQFSVAGESVWVDELGIIDLGDRIHLEALLRKHVDATLQRVQKTKTESVPIPSAKNIPTKKKPKDVEKELVVVNDQNALTSSDQITAIQSEAPTQVQLPVLELPGLELPMVDLVESGKSVPSTKNEDSGIPTEKVVMPTVVLPQEVEQKVTRPQKMVRKAQAKQKPRKPPTQ